VSVAARARVSPRAAATVLSIVGGAGQAAGMPSPLSLLLLAAALTVVIWGSRAEGGA